MPFYLVHDPDRGYKVPFYLVHDPDRGFKVPFYLVLGLDRGNSFEISLRVPIRNVFNLVSLADKPCKTSESLIL